MGAVVLSIAAFGYSEREGVDFSLAKARIAPGRLLVSYVISMAAAVALMTRARHRKLMQARLEASRAAEREDED